MNKRFAKLKQTEEIHKTVELREVNEICPLCDGELYCVFNKSHYHVLDGNIEWVCEKTDGHNFYKNPRSIYLYQHKEGNSGNHTFEYSKIFRSKYIEVEE